ncbi:hypothetical protein ACFC0M_10335 [Streptomyces sp. NPDC056149]|uniref:hypothetical protein n=1 Tax=unclassified Streptomyces TaxID=2593676 RepID=UPI002380FF5E|nr:hypothetical protein [Streptomyces sp. WZ-12]
MAKWLIVAEEMVEVEGGPAQLQVKTLQSLGELDRPFALKRLQDEAKKYTPQALQGASKAICRRHGIDDEFLIVARDRKGYAPCTVRLLEDV